MNILFIDPGESTGWVLKCNSELHGGTIKLDREGLWTLLNYLHPDIIVYETFKLYPGHAKSMIGNTFYTCEIIGVLHLYAELNKIPIKNQDASIKKYSGARTTDPEWQKLQKEPDVTGHTFDAYQHMKYFRRLQNGADR